MTSWLRRHKLLAYFTLTFGISWVGTLIVLATTSFDLAALPPWETGVIFVLMVLGPSTSALVLTALLRGTPSPSSALYVAGIVFTLARWAFAAR
jgi:hypothetical protein